MSAFASLVAFKCFPGALQLWESSDPVPASLEIALPPAAHMCVQIHILADRQQAASGARACYFALLLFLNSQCPRQLLSFYRFAVHMKGSHGILCFDLFHNQGHSRCSVNECRKQRGNSVVGTAGTPAFLFPKNKISKLLKLYFLLRSFFSQNRTDNKEI